MSNNVVFRMWNGMNSAIRRWDDQRTYYRRENLAREREQFIETLQKRYGYTKEKATSELQKHYSKIRRG